MNKFFYYNSLCSGSSMPTAFSSDPFVTAVKDLLILELQQVVYYIEKLRDLNVDMSEYSDKVIDFISILIVNLDFNKESFFVIVQDLYKNKKLLEQLYISACENTSIQADLLFENSHNLSSKEEILKVLNQREKDIQVTSEDIKLSKNKKSLFEIMINLVLNSCNCLIDLKNYGVDLKLQKDNVLKLFNTANFPLSEDEIIDIIKSFSKSNYEIMLVLYDNIVKKYGPIVQNEVPRKILKGKSILVSGTSLADLEKILKAVKGLNINVYAHYELINAFKYKKFLEFPNLVGLYQKAQNNFLLDFSSFDGPIYVSRNSIPKIDVIRGQIYTPDKYPAFGISKIANDDFSPIIEYALQSVGFINDENLKSISIGYSLDDIEDAIAKLIYKLKINEVKKVFIIGFVDVFSKNNSYIKEFISACSDDCFIISFGVDSKKDNFLFINPFYDFSILYKIIVQMSSSIQNIESILSVFLLDCNSTTVAHIFNMIHLKIKNIFLGPCCPNIISPTLSYGLKKLFGVNSISTPIEDIQIVLK